MNLHAHRRRAASRSGDGGNGAASSILETLLDYLTDRIARSAMRRVNRGVHEVVRWTVLRMVLGWVGAALLTGGVLLLLGAAVKGLEALQCPLWLALLSTGLLALLVSLLAMKDLLWPGEALEDDD